MPKYNGPKYEDEVFKLYLNVLSLLKERDLDFTAMFRLHGISLEIFDNMRKGKACWLITLLRICEALKINLEELVKDVGRFGSDRNNESLDRNKDGVKETAERA